MKLPSTDASAAHEGNAGQLPLEKQKLSRLPTPRGKPTACLLTLLVASRGRTQSLVDAGSLPLLARTALPAPNSLLLLTFRVRRVG